jgi:hypothetical protein
MPEESLPSDQNAIAALLNTPIEVDDERECVRLLAIGSPQGITALTRTLYKRGFAEVGAWSKLLPGRHPGEVMSVFTWPIRLR